MNVHIAIPVKNLEASKAFYEQLGFSVMTEYEKPGDQLRIVRLSHGGEYILELMGHTEAATMSFQHRPELQHIGIIVEDLDAAFSNLQKRNVPVLKPITAGVAVKRFAFVADPSGYPVELIEPLP